MPVNAAVPDGRAAKVVVVYNQRLPESREVADHYAVQRGVAESRLLGVKMPTSEVVTREEFETYVRAPIWSAFLENGWFRYEGQPVNAGEDAGPVAPKQAAVRYLVLCHGVPLKVRRDPDWVEAIPDKMPANIRRNEAAVDSELALLPVWKSVPLLAGPWANPVRGRALDLAVSPTNGVLMVARLDGPDATLAKALVDRALAGEREGLRGRFYLDARGIQNGSYVSGDMWIKQAARVAEAAGWETVLDDQSPIFPAEFPLSDVAFYAGWYAGEAAGAFGLPEVDFRPGAIAYHLHSFSAATLRNPHRHWAAPLLHKGAAATMGCVYEPYLTGTPDVGLFTERLMVQGFTLGEAAYASIPVLSWQITVVGDPLYRPFPPRENAQANSEDAWEVLRWANLSLRSNGEAEVVLNRVRQRAAELGSAVLWEKAGDLYREAVPKEAALAYEQALGAGAGRWQKVRLRLALAGAWERVGKDAGALSSLQALVEEDPGYPALEVLYNRMAGLARTLGRMEEAERYERLALRAAK